MTDVILSRWTAYSLAALFVVTLAGCSEQPKSAETAKYSTVPVQCSNAIDSARNSVSKFAGSLFDPTQNPVTSPSAGPIEAELAQAGEYKPLSCDIVYERSDSSSATPPGVPTKRALFVFFTLYEDKTDPVGAARKAMDTSTKDSSLESPFGHPVAVSNIGENSRTYWNFGSNSANVEFRISNLRVRVFLTGTNKAINPTSSELRTELEENSVPIAREIAAGL